MSEKVVVTGGAGFIGSHLCHRLVQEGFQVAIIDNLYRGRMSYIEDLLLDGNATLHSIDIRSPLIEEFFQGAKYVFHMAAVCINYSVACPDESLDINVRGTFNVFNSAFKAGVKKVIFASSASVYGDPEYLPMDESHPLNPITPYCISKIAGEQMLRMKLFNGLPYMILRNFNVYGKRQPVDAYYTNVIINFVNRISQGLQPIIIGDGSQSMDFVNVKDVVDANIKAAFSDVKGEIVNIGSGNSVSVKELANDILKIFEADLEPIYKIDQKSIVTRRQADISKAKDILQFEPKISLIEGLKELSEDIHNNPKMY